MKQKVAIRKLLHTKGSGTYIHELNLTQAQDARLREARKTVRTTLRADFARLRDELKKSQEPPETIKALTPKFWTQGSHAYGTQNRPAICPPQQIDLDDGIYFPMSIVEGQPTIARAKLQQRVDTALEELAKRMGWKYEKKRTCGRLVINDELHIDVPLYAIPDDRHKIMLEAMQRAKSAIGDSYLLDKSIRLDPNEVYLAVRDEEQWVRSDPMEIHRWYVHQTSLYPAGRLNRVCRYLKGWRDHTWEKGGPSSIALMAAASATFGARLATDKQHFDTDCEALLAVAEELPNRLRQGILNPTDKNEKLFPRGHSETEIRDVDARAEVFKGQLQAALGGQLDNRQVIDTLRTIFGSRIPDKVEWVERLREQKIEVQPSRQSTHWPSPPLNMRSA